jgi:hypothetical protein
LGGIAFGGVAGGLISFGGVAMAIFLAIGGMAVGGISFGGLAVGVISLGGGAVGLYAFGGWVWGLHALGGNANDPEAMRFFAPWAADWWKWLVGVAVLSPVLSGVLGIVVWLVFRREKAAAEQSQAL